MAHLTGRRFGLDQEVEQFSVVFVVEGDVEWNHLDSGGGLVRVGFQYDFESLA